MAIMTTAKNIYPIPRSPNNGMPAWSRRVGTNLEGHNLSPDNETQRLHGSNTRRDLRKYFLSGPAYYSIEVWLGVSRHESPSRSPKRGSHVTLLACVRSRTRNVVRSLRPARRRGQQYRQS